VSLIIRVGWVDLRNQVTGELPHHPRESDCLPKTQPYSGVVINRPFLATVRLYLLSV
jgi:hypothetical protein